MLDTESRLIQLSLEVKILRESRRVDFPNTGAGALHPVEFSKASALKSKSEVK